MATLRPPQPFEGIAHAAARRFVDAIGRRDPIAAAVGYTADARLLTPSAALIEGRTGIESYWRAGLEAGIRSVELVPVRIDGHGAIGFEIGQYEIWLRPPSGASVVDRGTYLRVHQRDRDGAWSCSLEMFTPEGSPQVAPGGRPDTRREVIAES
jgi:ketosteroid isomerase-like protein